MRFYSTNRHLPGGFAPTVSARDAILTGQAPDQGLFMPETLPRFDASVIHRWQDRPYHEVAFEIADAFLHGEVPSETLRRICFEAYRYAVPLERVHDRTFVMRLDRGPTASFKDFAAGMLARLVAELREPDAELTVLVATSGDTGSAVGAAFKGIPGIQVRILYPRGEVSPLQKAQLDTIGGNVGSIAVAGKFDDCQALVKRAFADPTLDGLHLTSANSINFGRIIPQIAYYFYAYAQLAHPYERMTVSVPSGNFGNALGCELARRMGLNVGALILATNENDEFPRFLATGLYQKIAPSRACLSNAMNVGHPSNLARFFDLYGGTVDKDGTVHKLPDRAAMQEHLASFSVSDADTRRTMLEARDRYKLLLEPHGAVGWAGLQRWKESGREASLSVVLETAHPYKFHEIVEETLGFRPEPPESMRALAGLRGRSVGIPNDYAALKDALLYTRVA